MLEYDEDKGIEYVEKELDILRAQSENKLKIWTTKHIPNIYKEITDATENLARILGYILHRDLYGETYDTTVQRSLISWFNYGQRSPYEMQMAFDIPYISFPIRSIDNWRRRLSNPRYAVLMDDIIDGIYGQYADEDGQYSEFEQFMIKNGWIPITNKFGVRAGSGAFDVMNLFTDTPDNITQRRNPILRGLQKFIETGDLQQAAKQLSTVGILNRAAQTATLGAYNSKTNAYNADNRSIGKTLNMFFDYSGDYEKYTPYRYRNNNGRYIWYENIYKNWFNKYGRMRKPTTDPVQMVKNIQWQQFVKRMQHKYRR